MYLPEGSQEISERMLSHCTSLRSLTIPSSVEIIGECAFQCSYNLTCLNIPENIEISMKPFGDQCFRLEELAAANDNTDIVEYIRERMRRRSVSTAILVGIKRASEILVEEMGEAAEGAGRVTRIGELLPGEGERGWGGVVCAKLLFQSSECMMEGKVNVLVKTIFSFLYAQDVPAIESAMSWKELRDYRKGKQ